MGHFCAGTNTVSRQNEALHPSHPLYIQSFWLKPARLSLDWLRILIDHPYWLESYQSENKKSDPVAEVSKHKENKGLEMACPDLPGQAEMSWPRSAGSYSNCWCQL